MVWDFLNLIVSIYKWSIAPIILTGGGQNAFPGRVGVRQGCSPPSTSIPHPTGRSSQCKYKSTRNNRHGDGTGEIKVLIFEDNLITYVGNSKKILKVINDFSKFTEYEANM